MIDPILKDWLWLVLWPSLPVGIVVSIVLNYSIYYFIYHSKMGKNWLLKKRYYEYVHSKDDFVYEIRNAIIPEAILGVLVTFMLNSNNLENPLKPYFSVRWEISLAEMARVPFEFLFLFVAYEVYYYAFHYFMHRSYTYRFMHTIHHKALYPTPQTATSVNLLEALGLYTFFALMILGPFNIVTLVIVSLYIKFFSVIQHLGHEFFPPAWRRSPYLKYLNSIWFHQLHHSGKLNKNFSFVTNVLDRIFGTMNPDYLRYETQESNELPHSEIKKKIAS